ncbi:hypothetical protein [Aliivibrio sp. S10_S31]|uniref:hypothetical protein n=1 Tax=Aliivibrio sp. S10_S31 TaxID=2720224 RepID=UPI001681C08B|nr:hypothetical protein [Aliivibrio sp. S10_S31]MBD1571550.1 hypothetical protein [Aliivibrio sp. S10_S31]
MELESFLAGLCASLVGVVATVCSTNKVESIKQNRDVENVKNALYVELNDLANECYENIDTVYDVYARAIMYKKTGNDALFNSYSLPRPPVLIVLNNTLEKCYVYLTKDQRDAIRTILYLVDRMTKDLESIDAKGPYNHKDIQSEDLYAIISILGVIYQLAIAFKEEKDRFKNSNKSADVLFKETLTMKKLSLDWSDIREYLKTA